MKELEAKINQDFINFKELFLKKFDDFNFHQEESQGKINQGFDTKFFQTEVKQEELKLKLLLITDEVHNEKQKNDKFNGLLNFKTYAEEHITTLKKKVLNLTTDLKIATERYNKVVLENLDVPGIVGHLCQFENLRKYIEVNYFRLN